MGVSPHTIKHFPGLYTSCNPLAVPEGAQDIADNCVVRSADILESRRGYSAVASPGAVTNALAFKQGKLVSLTYDDPGRGVTGALRYYDPIAAAWVSISNPLPIAQPGGNSTLRTRMFAAQKAIYFQSTYGLTKIESLSSTALVALRQTFMTQNLSTWPLITHVAPNSSGPVNWLISGNQTAYRFTLCRLGANGELIESEPSERVYAVAIGFNSYVITAINTPWLFTSDSFVRIYRSIVQSSSSVDPSDEMFLVGEVTPAYSVAGASFFNDYMSDGLAYKPLYSNLQSGTAPGRPFASAPLSSDAIYFKNRAYYFNTSDVQRYSLTMIGTGSGGVNDGDWISINGVKFTFISGPSTSGPQVIRLWTGGTVTANIDSTVRGLVSAINQYFLSNYGGSVAGSSTVMARYLSTYSTTPGQMLIQSVLPGATTISIQTSSPAGWASDYTAGVTSSANTQAAGLSWSEQYQPEAVPLSNSTIVGDASDAGQRAVALRDAALLYKTNDGVWKVTDDGTSVGPTVTLLDPTVKLIAPDTLQVIDNLAIGLCADGVIAMSEMGKVNLSHDQIERDLFKLMSYVGVTTLQRYAFGVSYAQEHTYLMALPESPNATSATLIYAYNTETHAWTRWRFRLGVLAGSVNPDTGQLVWAMSDGTIWIERKNGDSSDYQDPGFTLTSPVSTATATMVFAGDLTQGATPVETGDVFQQFQATFALQQRVRSVVYSSGANQTTVTLDAAPAHAWTATPLTVLKAIRATARFLPFHAEAPMTDKSWGTMFLFFRYFDQDWMTVGFASEKAQLFQNVEQVAGSDKTSPQGVIPLDVWAPTPWANTSANADFWGRRAQNVMLQVSIPQDFNPSAQLGLTLIFANALERWELAGIDLKIMVATHRPVR